MSVTTELCAELRERFEGRPPQQYMVLPYEFRAELAGKGIKLYNIRHPERDVEIGEDGRDAAGYKWFLRFGWRNEVKALVTALGMEAEEDIEVITW